MADISKYSNWRLSKTYWVNRGPGMEKCKRHRKGSSRPFLTLIRHQSRLPQLKDRSSSDELTWNLSYAWSNFTKTVQKRTSKEENTKNHCFNPQCRKSLCNSFIRDWNVSEKNGKIKTETTFYFHILFVKSCKARFYCCPGSSIPTLDHWLGLSLPLQNLKTERKQVWILPHTSTIDHWQYSKIMNLKLSQWFWGTASFEYCFCLFVISVEEAVMAVKCQRACKGPPSQPVPFSCSGTM